MNAIIQHDSRGLKSMTLAVPFHLTASLEQIWLIGPIPLSTVEPHQEFSHSSFYPATVSKHQTSVLLHVGLSLRCATWRFSPESPTNGVLFYHFSDSDEYAEPF